MELVSALLRTCGAEARALMATLAAAVLGAALLVLWRMSAGKKYMNKDGVAANAVEVKNRQFGLMAACDGNSSWLHAPLGSTRRHEDVAEAAAARGFRPRSAIVRTWLMRRQREDVDRGAPSRGHGRGSDNARTWPKEFQREDGMEVAAARGRGQVRWHNGYFASGSSTYDDGSGNSLVIATSTEQPRRAQI